MKEQLDNDRGFFENVNAKSKRLGEQHHGAHTVQPVQRRQIHDAADVQHQNDILAPTDAYELLRCEAAPAILQTFEIR